MINQPYQEPVAPVRLWERRFVCWVWWPEVLLGAAALLAVLGGLIAGVLSLPT